MHKGLQLIILLLLIPVFAETIDIQKFSITIPGFPLTLGRALFVVCGIFGIANGGRYFFRTGYFKGLLLVIIGCTIGALFSGDVMGNLSRTFAMYLLLIGACGIGSLLKYINFRILLDAFFCINFIYWCYYIIDLVVLSGNFSSYGILKGINHHIPGMNISISTIYIGLRYYRHANKLSPTGYFIFAVGIACCLLAESRSNFMFTILVIVIIMVKEKKNMWRLLLVIIPVIIVTYQILDYLMSQNEALNQRFSIEDIDYQERTTAIRITLIYEAIKEIILHPFGKGIRNIELSYDNNEFLIHNQYLTFILAGGLTATAGIFYWMKDLLFIMKNIFSKNRIAQSPLYLAFGFTLLTYSITLTTIENSSLLFYILAAMGIFLSAVSKEEKRITSNPIKNTILTA